MLTINNPEHAKQRAEVKHLTLEEQTEAVNSINNLFKALRFIDNPAVNEIMYQTERNGGLYLLQRLIYKYENYRHFFEVVGGWEGFNKIVSEHDKLSDYINILYYHNEIQKNAEQILKDK